MVDGKVFRGDRLREARKAANMKGADLAKALGIDFDSDSGKTQISRYENGRIEPQTAMLDKMAKVLNVSTDWLLGRTVNPAGIITKDSLTPEQKAVLDAFEADDLDTYIDLQRQRRKKSSGNKPTTP